MRRPPLADKGSRTSKAEPFPAVIDEIDGRGVGGDLASAMPPTGNADTLARRCARRGDQGSVNFGVRLAHGVAFGVASRELDRKIGESFVP